MKIGDFITRNGVTNVVACGVKDKHLVLNVGVCSAKSSPRSDHMAKTQSFAWQALHTVSSGRFK
jgi:hypothetical protein